MHQRPMEHIFQPGIESFFQVLQLAGQDQGIQKGQSQNCLPATFFW